MEFSVSGNALKTYARSITCLARIGSELAIQASPSQLNFHSLNSSRSAYQSISFKSAFFDAYTISGSQIQCSVLLKAICSVLRTPIASIDHLTAHLPDPDASKVQWILDCNNGDYNHCNSTDFFAPDAASEIGGKAVELRSYIDPSKDNDSSLHTQLWIDPSEEFVQYNHTGDPVDVTFGVKELKAFLSFCEGCEVDIHLYFEKAGEPILMAPKFGLDDGSTSNFDATLVLATMLVSQLQGTPTGPPPVETATTNQSDRAVGSKGKERAIDLVFNMLIISFFGSWLNVIMLNQIIW